MFLLLGTVLIGIILVLVWNGSVIGSSSQSVAVAVPSRSGQPVHDAVTQQHSADVARLLAVSWLTLAFTAVASAPLGWFAAGRMLRPLRQMTTAARTISAGNLHDRLGLTGPEDEFKQLGDTVDDLLGRLEAAFAAQRRFVANAAHELRTPLTLERTLLQVALGDPNASTESLRATCEELLASGRSQERLLEALLTLATSERGLEQSEPLDLAPLVQRELEQARADIDRKQLRVTAVLVQARSRGDRALIERLIANLLENAVGHNHNHGSIEVTTESGADRAVLRVANTGRTIGSDEVERLFEPFHRGGAVRTAANGHHGLGLSIARAIVRAHYGEICAEPAPGGGLIVTVRLPVAP
jgi:signal transduction histidine kinase